MSSSHRQILLDYGKRVLRLDSALAQGMVGNLQAAGATKLSQLSIFSDLDLGSVVMVSLDGKPLENSARMLLQVMTEERPNGFSEAPAGDGLFRIRADDSAGTVDHVSLLLPALVENALTAVGRIEG